MGRAADAVSRGLQGLTLEEFLGRGGQSFTGELHPRDRLGKFRKALHHYERREDAGYTSSAESTRGDRIVGTAYELPQEDFDKLSHNDLVTVERALQNTPTTPGFERRIRDKVAKARTGLKAQGAEIARTGPLTKY
jgi:hypothetical protein